MGILFSDVFYGWDAFQKVQVAGWLLIVAFGGVSVNTLFTFPDRRCITGGRTPPSPAGRASPAALGRGGISAFNTVKPFLELRQQMLDTELANSRLAMAAIRDMLFQGISDVVNQASGALQQRSAIRRWYTPSRGQAFCVRLC